MKSYTLLNLACYSIFVSGFTLSTSATRWPIYEEAKKDFEDSGKIQSYDHGAAKNWFRGEGHGEKFETYAETKDFFKKKGYLSREADESVFVREGESYDPNVYHDVMTCLFLSDFVYRVANLRKDTKKYSFTKEGLRDEVTFGDSFVSEEDTTAMAQMLMGNLKVSEDPEELSHPINMKQFEDVLDYGGYGWSNKKFANIVTVSGMKSFHKKDMFFYKFDAKFNQKNLVYSISGRESKEGELDLFLAFRGSATARDWFQNLQAPMVEIILRYDEKTGKAYLVEQINFQKIEIEKALYDEFKKITEEGPPIMVHRGFLDYLFADRKKNGISKKENELDDSMYTNIRINLERLMAKKATVNNALYVTGHSLGGALATLASFFLASDKGINDNSADWRGVSCISFASPQVGNVSFQKAFEVLQSKKQHQSAIAKPTKLGRLFSNIRITNNRDPVPLLLFPSKYRHVAGYHVHLNRPSILSLWRPRKPSIEIERSQPQIRKHDIFKNLTKPWKIFPETSYLRGLFTNSRHLFGFLLTVFPSILILPLTILKNSLPTPEGFSGVLSQIGNSKLFLSFVALLPQALTSAISTFAKTPLFKIGLVGIPVAFLFSLMTKEESSTFERIGMWIALMMPLTYYYTKYEKAAIIGLLAAQGVALAFRAPGEVLTIDVHSLLQYYDHSRPHHQMLSSSEAIFDIAGDINA